MPKTHNFTPEEIEEKKKIARKLRDQGCYYRYISSQVGVASTTLGMA